MRAAGEDERFMALTLELARRGRGSVEPNPMVGAVIVRDGVEIARGWHKRFGGPHAEREALAAARDAGLDVRGATMYVTLEPCCHHGKTPPCTEAIIAAGIARVVAPMTDPDQNVAGRGVAALRGAGVEVSLGACEAEARKLLAAYIKGRTTGRPWVICKWAQTADGCIALPAGQGKWISSPPSRRRVHELRGLCDGVCVGVATVVADDPLLTNRSGDGKAPTRVVLDSRLSLPPDCQLIRTAAAAPVLIATTPAAPPAKADQLRRAGAEVLTLPADQAGVKLEALLQELGRRQWTYLLVEGGAKVLGSFIYAGLADELIVFICPGKLAPARPDADAPVPARFDIADVGKTIALGQCESRRYGRDVMRRYVQ